MSEQTTRPTKTLGELERGDFVHYRRTADAVPGIVCEVKASLPFRDGDGRKKVSALLLPLSGGEPRHVRNFAECTFLVATDDDVSAAHDQARRRQLQDDLVALQGLLSSLAVRPSTYLGAFDVAVVDGEVSRIAETLGLPIDPFGGGRSRSVKWTAPGVEDWGQRLTVRFWGKPAEPIVIPAAAVDAMADRAADVTAEVDGTPEADQDWHFTFGSGLLYDGRYVVINGTNESARARMFEVFERAWCDQYSPASFAANFTPGEMVELPESEWPPVVADEDDEPAGEQEHRHVGGSAGGPGQNDVECACGVTYAGFDTHAEAMKLLDAHIADATTDEQSGR